MEEVIQAPCGERQAAQGLCKALNQFQGKHKLARTATETSNRIKTRKKETVICGEQELGI